MVTLLPHQATGAAFLAANPFGYLVDPPGLGKTGTAVTALDLVEAETVLAVAPAIVRHHWGRELEAFSKRPRRIVLATTPSWRQQKGEVYVLSYAQLAQRATQEWLRGRRWDALICDEAHALANPHAKITQAICGPGIHQKEGLVGAARHVWWLSGTPMRHHAHSLWTAARALCGVKFGYRDWIARYCIVKITPWGEQIIGTRMDRVDELRSTFADYMLRRKQDVISLPPLRFGRIILDMDNTDATTAALRQELRSNLSPAREKRLLAMMEGAAVERADAEDGVAVATLRRLVGELKAGPTALLTDSLLDEGVPAVVLFAHHRTVISALRKRLDRHKPLVLDGATSVEDRRQIVESFQSPGGPRVLICSISVAGTGVTFTRASRAILVEPSFSPIDNEQAAKRLHRIGQSASVLVSVVGLAGTFDERIAEIAQRKAQAQASFIRETA